MPLPRGSSAMMCSREVNTTRPSATMSLLFDGFPDDGERLLPNLAVRDDVVRRVEIKFVDFALRDELFDVDQARAVDRHRFKLLRLELDVLALARFVALDDVGLVDLVAGVGI